MYWKQTVVIQGPKEDFPPSLHLKELQLGRERTD